MSIQIIIDCPVDKRDEDWLHEAEEIAANVRHGLRSLRAARAFEGKA